MLDPVTRPRRGTVAGPTNRYLNFRKYTSVSREPWDQVRKPNHIFLVNIYTCMYNIQLVFKKILFWILFEVYSNFLVVVCLCVSESEIKSYDKKNQWKNNRIAIFFFCENKVITKIPQQQQPVCCNSSATNVLTITSTYFSDLYQF